MDTSVGNYKCEIITINIISAVYFEGNEQFQISSTGYQCFVRVLSCGFPTCWDLSRLFPREIEFL